MKSKRYLPYGAKLGLILLLALSAEQTFVGKGNAGAVSGGISPDNNSAKAAAAAPRPDCFTSATKAGPAVGGINAGDVQSDCSGGGLAFTPQKTLSAPVSRLGGAQEGAVGGPRRTALAEETFRRLVSKAAETGRVRVIVGLDVAFAAVGTLSAAQANAQRGRITQAQEGLLSELSGFEVRSVKRFPFIPYLAMEIDARGLDHMQASPTVNTIEEDVPVPPSLAESVPLIGAPAAWASGYSGAGEAVAILDTGVDGSHPFLSGKVVSEACYSTNSSSSVSLCPGGASQATGTGSGVNCNTAVSGCNHGTHVAGIAAGSGASFSGVAKDASIIAIQIFSRFDSQSTCGGVPTPCVLTFTSDYILGLQRVQALGGSFNIAAANMSLGGGRFFANCDSSQSAAKAAIDNLRSLGIATVIASGNDGYADSISSPACISTAVSVGSTDDGSFGTTADAVSSFSNGATFLNLLAPGKWITSSVPGGGFSTFSGTSMATPHVTGAWAVLKSKSRAASVDQVLTALTTTGKPVTDPRNNITKPRIKVDAAVNALPGGGPPPPVAGAATGVTVGGFTANWAASSGATGYRLDVSLSSSFSSFVSGYQDLDVGNVTSRAVSGLGAGTTYYYRVRAYNAGGVSGYSNVVTVTTTSSSCATRVNGISRRAGRTSGGQQVTLTGDFACLSTLSIGGTPVAWSYNGGTGGVAFNTPAHDVGAVDIVLTPSSGGAVTIGNAFAYLPTTFTDDPLVAGVTQARTQHVIELRQAVDALRAVAGLAPAAWADPVLLSFVTLIKPGHIQELRVNLEDAAARLGYPAATYTEPSLGPGSVIKRVHIEELRQRIRNIAG